MATAHRLAICCCNRKDVEGVAPDYGRPGQTFLRTLSLHDARRYLAQGQFPPGSMGPKIKAAIAFLQGGGRRAVITSIEAIEAAVQGQAGTEIQRG